MTWYGAGAWLIFSQSRQLNFSRTCWITFQDFVINYIVSVMSSSYFYSLAPPLHAHSTDHGTRTLYSRRPSAKSLRVGR